MSRTVVDNGNLERDNVTFGRCWIATGKCFDRDKISSIVDNDEFFEVIAHS